MNMDTIRVFAISKLAWIKKQQAKLQAQVRETPRDLLDRESHYVWGRRYLMEVIEAEQARSITLKGKKILLQIRPHTSGEKRQEILEDWYREQLKAEVPALITKWQKRMDVTVERFYVQRMKTRWGSCNPRKRSIRLNTDLARKPTECLEYIMVHEMTHLLEPTHNARFMTLMDKFMPNWQHRRDQLNHLPVRHEEWVY
jgi:predicted metal-dependent hydrolase